MEFVQRKPDHKNWVPTPNAETTAARTDLEKRSGYSGRPGPYWDEAVGAYGAHVRHLEREITRYDLHGTEPMYPPESKAQLNSKGVPQLIEQTPFGAVLANASKQNDPNWMNDGMVSYIKTRDEDFEPDEEDEESEQESSAGPTKKAKAKKLKFESYADLVGHMRSSGRGPEMAHAVLREVYLTLARRVDGEDDEKRQEASMKRQADLAAEWTDPVHRRVMAVLYALTILSEDQRSAGGKIMRSALRLIADERLTPEEAFKEQGIEGPAVAQTKRKGGMKLLRFSWRGGAHASAKAKLVHDEASASSDGEDDPKVEKARRLKSAGAKRKDDRRIRESKLLGAKRAAGRSTHPDDASDVDDADDEDEGEPTRRRRADQPTSSGDRKRKRGSGQRVSSRPRKLRRLDDDDTAPGVPQSEPSGQHQRRSARLAGPRPAQKRKLDDDEPAESRQQSKRRRLSAPKVPRAKL